MKLDYSKLEFLNQLFRKPHIQMAQPVVCLMPNAVVLVNIDASHKLQYYDYLEHESEQQLQALNTLTERYGLIVQSCGWVLAPGQYQLLMADAPKVPLNEMADAIQWNIKELLDYPMDNVVLDVFTIPEYGAKQRKKVFVTAADKTWLETKVRMFEDAYLPITLIDIADLALRNVMSYYPSAERPLVLLHLYGSSGKLLLNWQQNLYSIRNLSFNVNAMSEREEFFNTLLLEVQRSFDYCQFELKLDTPQKIIITPHRDYAQPLADYLEQNLKISAECVDLNKLLVDSENLSQEIQQKIFYAIGSAMTGWFISSTKQG